MSEWFKEPVLKTGDSSRAVGSNPTLSATLIFGQNCICHLHLQPCRSTQVAIRGSPAKGVVGLNRARVRIPPSAPRRSKVRFAPTSFYAYGKKDVIRPLPCSSFPNRTRCAGLRFDFGWKPGSIGIYTVVIFQLVANDISLCDEFFHFIAKLIARSFCCSSIPNRTRCRWAPVWGRRFAAVLSDLEKYRF